MSDVDTKATGVRRPTIACFVGDEDHPEATCQRCGGPNLSWYVASDLWNAATEDGPLAHVNERGCVLCPLCFVEAWEAATGRDITWELRPDPLGRYARERKVDG